MKTIRHTATLYYYDGPQIFEGLDADGGLYVGVMLLPDGERERYLVVGVGAGRLNQFRAGNLDLRALLLERVEASWYVASPSAELAEVLELDARDGALVEFAELPEAGFFLHDSPIETAAQRNDLGLARVGKFPETAGRGGERLSNGRG